MFIKVFDTIIEHDQNWENIDFTLCKKKKSIKTVNMVK